MMGRGGKEQIKSRDLILALQGLISINFYFLRKYSIHYTLLFCFSQVYHLNILLNPPPKKKPYY